MQGYGADSYGEAFADVYDDWYADGHRRRRDGRTGDRLAGPRARVLELGVGTGRLAIPLARRRARRSSGSTPARRCSNDSPTADVGGSVTVVLGDMVDDLPDGPFDLVFVAYNTLFNLVDDGAQRRCFAAVAERLAPGGSFVVEAFVPDAAADPRPDRARRSRCDRWASTTSCSPCRATTRASSAPRVSSSTFTESGGVRLRPWTVRWSTPGELDAMAAAAGLDARRTLGRHGDDPLHRRLPPPRIRLPNRVLVNFLRTRVRKKFTRTHQKEW